MKIRIKGARQRVDLKSVTGHESSAYRQASAGMHRSMIVPIRNECLVGGGTDAPHASEPQLAATRQEGAGAHVNHTGTEIERMERIGTLFRFFNYLHMKGVLADGDTLDKPEVQHKLQRCAYIAKKLGTDMGYEFGFLDSGAFSTDIAIDIYDRGCGEGGTEPFVRDPDASRMFVHMVQGRNVEWLDVATFALRENHGNETLDEFVKRMKRENIEYGKKLVMDVFGHVRACMNGEVTGQA